jgi:hypothetical protein
MSGLNDLISHLRRVRDGLRTDTLDCSTAAMILDDIVDGLYTALEQDERQLSPHLSEGLHL